MTHTIFIDGSAGTTGLQIRERLAGRSDMEVLELVGEDRKDPQKRAEAINDADFSILCLPDAAARESVSFARSNTVRIIDTSTAHRVDADWIYGMPELTSEQPDLIRQASRVSNPGCYPTGPILMLRPLSDAGILPADYPISVTAISGYTGGGRQMIEKYETPGEGDPAPSPFHLYKMQMEHKHLAEMRKYTGLNQEPIFSPSVGFFPQGMITQVPLYLNQLDRKVTVTDIQDILEAFHGQNELIDVVPQKDAASLTQLDATELIGSDGLRIYVFGHEAKGQVMLTAIYDNLGKGASGAAVQNLDLMLSGA